ncbi:MAG: hypothetical protein ABIJ75_10200 [Actinomycetota bacterium]
MPQDSDVPGHVHDAGDVYGEFDDDVLFGDLRSYNWDGGSDLSAGADATATKGYLGDASAGAIQTQTLYAEGGTVGGWTLAATTLTGGDAILAADGNLYLGTGNDIARMSPTNATYRLWVGHATGGSAPFRVSKAGALFASGATISGAITATSGSIEGWLTITGSGGVRTAASGNRLEITTDEKIRFYAVDDSLGGEVGYDEALGVLSVSARPAGGGTLLLVAPSGAGNPKVRMQAGDGTLAFFEMDHSLGTSDFSVGTLLEQGSRVFSPNNPPPKYLTKVTRDAIQSIPNNTWTAVLWNTETYDTGGWHSVASNTDRITPTLPDQTVVNVKSIIQFASNATGVRAVRVLKSGSSIGMVDMNAVSGAASRVPIAVDSMFGTGDYYTLEVYQTSGAALDVASGVENTHFSVTNQ